MGSVSVEPLIEYAERVYRPRNEDERSRIGSVGRVASVFGVSTNAVRRWHRVGLSVWQADRLAVKRLGVHPAMIWPDWGRESVDL